jgi:FtsP/CotA-like multicopper oxidase with cupredoxin domain
MTCEYEWKIEWDTTMSFACGNCPFNLTDCSNKNCMAANGVVRPVMVANKMLPGPQINVCKGDLINVLVHTELFMSEGITIHW